MLLTIIYIHFCTIKAMKINSIVKFLLKIFTKSKGNHRNKKDSCKCDEGNSNVLLPPIDRVLIVQDLDLLFDSETNTIVALLVLLGIHIIDNIVASKDRPSNDPLVNVWKEGSSSRSIIICFQKCQEARALGIFRILVNVRAIHE